MSTRFLLLALAVAQLDAASVGAPRAARAPQEAGLLIGLSSGATLWLPQRADSMRVEWSAPYLVVPRTDAYWIVMSATRCSLDLESEHIRVGAYPLAFRESWTALAIGRAGDSAQVSLGGLIDCDAAADSVRTTRARQFREALAKANSDTSLVEQTPPERDEIDVDCVTDHENTAFVSPNVIAIQSRYSQTEACAPGGATTSGSNRVRKFTSPAPIALHTLIPRAVFAKHPLGNESDRSCGAEEQHDLDSAWVPRRARGRWLVSVWLEGSNACGGGSDYERDAPLPRSFTGEPPLPIAWGAIQRQHPSLRDASASPSGSRIALLIGDTLIVHRVRNGQLGDEIARVYHLPGDSPVMYRWATAAEAARWTRDLPSVPPLRLRLVENPR